MNCIRFAQSNVVMKAPQDMPACHDVHAYTDGHVCVTLWKPTPQERAALVAGADIYLSVHMGGGMPPISFSTESPFIEPPTTERLEEIADGAPACATCIHFTIRAAGDPLGDCARWKKPNVPFHYACPEHHPR